MSDAHQRILGTILSNLPGMLALKDKKLAYTVANPAFCQFLGKGPAEIVGKTDTDLFPQAEAAASAKEDLAVLKSGMARNAESQLSGKPGTRWFDSARAAILDENGDPAGVMFTAYDITDFKEREIAIQAAEAKVADAEQQAAAAAQQAVEAAQRATSAESALAEVQARLAELEQSSANQRAAVEGMLQEKAALQDQVVDLQQQAADASAAATASQAKAGELAQQLEAAEAQATAAQESIRQQLLVAQQERDAATAQAAQGMERMTQAAQLAKQLGDLLGS